MQVGKQGPGDAGLPDLHTDDDFEYLVPTAVNPERLMLDAVAETETD